MDLNDTVQTYDLENLAFGQTLRVVTASGSTYWITAKGEGGFQPINLTGINGLPSGDYLTEVKIKSAWTTISAFVALGNKNGARLWVGRFVKEGEPLLIGVSYGSETKKPPTIAITQPVGNWEIC